MTKVIGRGRYATRAHPRTAGGSLATPGMNVSLSLSA